MSSPVLSFISERKVLREVWDEEEGTELRWREVNGGAHPV